MHPKSALSAQDVAEMLGVSKNTIYNMIKKGELVSYMVGRKVRFTEEGVRAFIHRSQANKDARQIALVPAGDGAQNQNGFIICGQDIILDVLSNYMRLHGIPALRAYVGSYDGLTLLYKNKVNVTSSNLWDGGTDEYNVPYIQRLLPGTAAVVIHLTYRMQGLYVRKGNPKNITGWEDFRRDDITMINREYGAGSRVLLDENLKLLGIAGGDVKGYAAQGQTYLAVASAVSSGKADVAVGIEKIARQADNIDFIPMKKERYDLIIKKEHIRLPEIQIMMNIINTCAFKREFGNIGGYNTSEMGRIIAEI
ncbi:MAG: helix-turn-helix transcriptional regulator [Spirochaetota bacterium]|jgi:putative molybdopterin biosynthesis protein|nr:helix-turn-helix transcriptional regulator [Spirochaetota bacterium]